MASLMFFGSVRLTGDLLSNGVQKGVVGRMYACLMDQNGERMTPLFRVQVLFKYPIEFDLQQQLLKLMEFYFVVEILTISDNVAQRAKDVKEFNGGFSLIDDV
nr:hypothetical protein [Tanacetum cinerariifolium]